MLVELAEIIKADSFDAQMATAFLTGIVAETKRFSNEKTTSRTMSLSAKLMAAGANQQLVASQLQSKSSISKMKSDKSAETEADGTLEIDHEPEKPVETKPEPEVSLPQPQPQPEPQFTPEPVNPVGDVRSEEHNTTPSDLLTSTPSVATPAVNPAFPAQAPSRGGTLTANTRPEDFLPAVDPLAQAQQQPMMQRGQMGGVPDNNLGDKTISKIEDAVIDQDKTLTDIEKTVDSPHAQAANPGAGLDSARDAVAAAATASSPRPEPRQDIATQGRLEVNNPAPVATPVVPAAPQLSIPSDPGMPAEQTGVSTPATAPPPVPPPMPMTMPGQTPPAS